MSLCCHQMHKGEDEVRAGEFATVSSEFARTRDTAEKGSGDERVKGLSKATACFV